MRRLFCRLRRGSYRLTQDWIIAASKLTPWRLVRIGERPGFRQPYPATVHDDPWPQALMWVSPKGRLFEMHGEYGEHGEA
jgi:hypothetical protein